MRKKKRIEKKKKNNIWKEKWVKSAHTHKKNRTSEKKESGKFFLDKVRVNVCCTGQFGISKWDFFFHFIYSSNWGDCNLVGQGRKPLDPNFPSHFFLLPNTQKYYFLFYFFPSFLKSTQPNKPVLKSHPFLSINGILE